MAEEYFPKDITRAVPGIDTPKFDLIRLNQIKGAVFNWVSSNQNQTIYFPIRLLRLSQNRS